MTQDLFFLGGGVRSPDPHHNLITVNKLDAADHGAELFYGAELFKGRFNEYGIGVWDANTGEQADFFYEPPGCARSDADRLQWLDGTGTIMVATMFPRTDSSFISLLDFRDKSVVWSWSDVGTPASLEDKHAVHAVVMEDGRSAVRVDGRHRLGVQRTRLRADVDAARRSRRRHLRLLHRRRSTLRPAQRGECFRSRRRSSDCLTGLVVLLL
ncbi:hypothetical protein BDA96_03G378400 [Sorghum bicolor]|uniref:At2g24240-like C-terminal beta-propeller domain-containing protein n=1 Tax=Sorghum bicolor TaxID=4558 RepID=A0A921UR04_SORBI|nr:hypothetical protein BDA96_03G378400 [Sorghum bicolor]